MTETKWTTIETDKGGGTIYRIEPGPLLWVCDNCGFTMDAGHCYADGSDNCPLCELAKVRARHGEGGIEGEDAQ